MSGQGETPDEDSEEVESIDVALGQTLYTEDGDTVGTIRGMEEGGIFVSVRDGAEQLTIEHARSGHQFGEAHLMWRCTTCGEMGEIDGGLPGNCTNCGAEKEELMYWKED